jgi:hypothetical protein
MDYYLEPENIHRLHEALYDLYCGYIERSVSELRPDGFWTGDDLSPFSQPKTGARSSSLCGPSCFASL